MPYEGNCLCGAVSFDITGEPFTYIVCHCLNCKQAGGGAFMANAFFKPQQVTLQTGSENIKTYQDGKTKSGNAIERSFCSTCGSSLFIKPAAGHGGILIVQSSNVKGSENWVPRKEVFTEQKCSWVKEIALQPKKAKL